MFCRVTLETRRGESIEDKPESAQMFHPARLVTGRRGPVRALIASFEAMGFRSDPQVDQRPAG